MSLFFHRFLIFPHLRSTSNNLYLLVVQTNWLAFRLQFWDTMRTIHSLNQGGTGPPLDQNIQCCCRQLGSNRFWKLLARMGIQARQRSGLHDGISPWQDPSNKGLPYYHADCGDRRGCTEACILPKSTPPSF